MRVAVHPTNHDAIGDRDFMDAETMNVIAIGGQLYRSRCRGTRRAFAAPFGSSDDLLGLHDLNITISQAFSIDPVLRVNFN